MGLELKSLWGALNWAGLDFHKKGPKLKLSTLIMPLRAQFISDEVAHTMQKAAAFYQCEKLDAQTLDKLLAGSRRPSSA